MPLTDFWIVFRWWGSLFFVGAAAFPLTKRLFSPPAGGWSGQGYVFSKAVGMAVVTWIVYVLGMAKIAPFSETIIVGAIVVVFLFGVFLSRLPKSPRLPIGTIIIEELFFFLALLFWSWVKAHEPSIRGLEKFMDYGFMQSILNSRYFPPPDMWYPPYPINYYYFGHMATALLTKLSGLDLAYTFNLMLSTIFAFCFTMSFSIGYQLSLFSHSRESGNPVNKKDGSPIRSGMTHNIFAGALTAFLVTLAGNMQTIYAFTRGYTGDPPAGGVTPFWELGWNLRELWEIGGIGEIIGKIGEGMNTYWYANATRFIPFTIHEFPSYSFVVSDVHGHVLSIPFVLLAIGMLIMMFSQSSVVSCQPARNASHSEAGGSSDSLKAESWILKAGYYGFLCGVLLMTNAIDGPIYLGLFIVVFVMTNWFNPPAGRAGLSNKRNWTHLIIVIAAAGITSMPFLSHFKSFVNGIAVNCPPSFLANSTIGPIIFEGLEKCQRSPFWMMYLLWGFFWFCGISFILKRIGDIREIRDIRVIWGKKFTHIEKVLVIFFVFSILLIIFPELFYFKDIYPQHFRSNTMFKLGYQAFIMFSIVAGYTIISFLCHWTDRRSWIRKIFFILLMPQLFLVSIFPMFSIRSYFGGLRAYEGVYGLSWLIREYPEDFAAIQWLKKQIISPPAGRAGHQSSVVRRSDSRRLKADSWTLVEADGDSYTDYERFSVFTGIPTPVGWAVHEWLWRGSYDVVSPRREDVRKIYESEDIEDTKRILNQYEVRYIIIGKLEREKFTVLNEQKFLDIGKEVFRSGETVVYEVY